MDLLLFVVGTTIVLVPYAYLKARSYKMDRDFHQLVPKWLSTDLPYEEFNGGYIIYANDSRWYIETWITFKLVWLPFGDGDGIAKTINDNRNLEYQCTWLPKYEMYRTCRRIINTHPNLTAPNIYWRLVKFFT